MLFWIQKNNALFVLMFKNWLRNFQGPFFSLLFPVISVWIMGSILITYAGKNPIIANVFLSIIPSFVSLIIISVGMTSFTNQLIDFKTSVIIKRIGVSPISKVHFFLASYLFVLVLCFISSLWIVAIIEIFFHKYIVDQTNLLGIHLLFDFSSVGTFILGWLLGILVATSISFWVASISNSHGKGIGIIMLFFFPTMFLSGAQLPPIFIQNSPSLKWISYFVPQRYPIQVMFSGFFSDHLFSPQLNPTLNNMYGNSKILPWHSALISLGFSLMLSSWTFYSWKWEN